MEKEKLFHEAAEFLLNNTVWRIMGKKSQFSPFLLRWRGGAFSFDLMKQRQPTQAFVMCWNSENWFIWCNSFTSFLYLIFQQGFYQTNKETFYISLLCKHSFLQAFFYAVGLIANGPTLLRPVREQITLKTYIRTELIS